MSSSPSDAKPPEGSIGEIWAFLNRDIRTIKWKAPNKPSPETNQVVLPLRAPTQPLEAPPPAIPSEVDTRQIEDLRIRREVLDWRDDFHFQFTNAAAEATKMLAELVEYEIAHMNFVRLRLLTRPASDVLKHHIESCVRSRMRRITQIEQAALHERLLIWLAQPPALDSMWIMWPKLEWDTHLAMKFTPDNRERILTALRDLILGRDGLADAHRQWATQFATMILEKRFANSV